MTDILAAELVSLDVDLSYSCEFACIPLQKNIQLIRWGEGRYYVPVGKYFIFAVNMCKYFPSVLKQHSSKEVGEKVHEWNFSMK